ncbi:MAG: hypothetical protein Q8O07_06155 [Chloroflexota bacterium]|nr:hypothetical protein [Chloroflexota bacterium]
MKAPQPGSAWFFVDESGDPTFYDRSGNLLLGQPGCAPLLMLGFVQMADPEPARRAILQLQREVVHDPYFQDFPSLAKTAVAFHATDDVPEIRYRVFKLLADLDFQAQFVVARKIERVFRDIFQANEGAFYDHLVATLLERVMHTHEHNYIYIARRGQGRANCR